MMRRSHCTTDAYSCATACPGLLPNTLSHDDNVYVDVAFPCPQFFKPVVEFSSSPQMPCLV
jgi:hypothetical protein